MFFSLFPTILERTLNLSQSSRHLLLLFPPLETFLHFEARVERAPFPFLLQDLPHPPVVAHKRPKFHHNGLEGLERIRFIAADAR